MQEVEKWGCFELELLGPQEGNPYVEVQLGAEFRYNHRIVRVEGFYDGQGQYKVRFMPDNEGDWSYRTWSDAPELDGVEGSFHCTAPTARNHGPVQVNGQHFIHADGTRFVPIGTTCYGWNHQFESLRSATLETLAGTRFNKLRMCIFPKHYDYNLDEPELYPFQGTVQDGFYEWDYTRFNPAFFKRLEGCIVELMKLGIEADLILFHPYDRWGFATMDAESDDRYLSYVVARLSAYRSIWWAMANEYDLMKEKSLKDWDRFFKLVQEKDPYQHLRSIHNWEVFYPHEKPWVTHCSIQHMNVGHVKKWRAEYTKPVVVDECCYEGNVAPSWGNITAEEMTHRMWDGMVRGGYVTHGETYMHEADILWWSKGGVLHGDSPERIAFLSKMMDDVPGAGLDPMPGGWDCAAGGVGWDYVLIYYGIQRPAHKILTQLPEGYAYHADVIDTWQMTITRLPEVIQHGSRVSLPSKTNIALRLTRIKDE